MPRSQSTETKLDKALKASVRPEHDKLDAVKDASQAIGEFIDYGAAEQGLTLCETHRNGRLYPTSRSIPAILARYFAIDQDKLEAEKQAMLDALRAVQQ